MTTIPTLPRVVWPLARPDPETATQSLPMPETWAYPHEPATRQVGAFRLLVCSLR